MLKKSGIALTILLCTFTICAGRFADAGSIPDTPPPDVSGDWNGTTTDHDKGSGSFTIMINQVGGKLASTWGAFYSESLSTFKGKVNAKGIVHLNLLVEGKCHIIATATLPNANEMKTTSYKYAGGCNKELQQDTGSFDVTR